MLEKIENVIIIGHGAAAHTAAIYAARASLSPLVIGDAQGNYKKNQAAQGEGLPGFPLHIDEGHLLVDMQTQAERFGTRYEKVNSIRVSLAQRPFTVTIGDSGKSHRAYSVIFADDAGCVKVEPSVPASLHAKGAASTVSGVFLCPQAMKSGDAPVHAILAAAEGCQACIETERSLQERAITASDQRTEQW